MVKGQSHYLREWRKFAGLSQEEVGTALKMKRQTISLIEKGKSDYTQGYLEGLAGLIGCEVIDLIRRPPDRPGVGSGVTFILASK